MVLPFLQHGIGTSILRVALGCRSTDVDHIALGRDAGIAQGHKVPVQLLEVTFPNSTCFEFDNTGCTVIAKQDHIGFQKLTIPH